ncbi:MAG: hypothetical protein GY851_10555 [bacterium]|nr:hypothetical protein [bacterium]
MAIGSNPTKIEELQIAGGYGDTGKGLSPAGGVDLCDSGDILTDGNITLDGDLTFTAQYPELQAGYWLRVQPEQSGTGNAYLRLSPKASTTGTGFIYLFDNTASTGPGKLYVYEPGTSNIKLQIDAHTGDLTTTGTVSAGSITDSLAEEFHFLGPPTCIGDGVYDYGDKFEVSQTTGGPTMAVRVAAGYGGVSMTRIKVASAQNSTGITAPSGNPRIDVTYVTSTGGIGIEKGTEAASPSAPAITTGKMSLAQVYLSVGDTGVSDSGITCTRRWY